MGRIEKIMLVFFFTAACVTLFSMISLGDAANEVGREVYSVSVLVHSPTERFMRGLEQAAMDYNVDVHIISSYASGDSVRQIEHLRRELMDNTDAVILLAEDTSQMEEFISTQSSAPKVVTVGQRLQRGKTVHVGPNDADVGKKLGELIIRRYAEKPYLSGGRCVLLLPETIKPHHTQRLEAVNEALRVYGLNAQTGTLSLFESEEAAKPGEDMILVALDESLLAPVCEQSRENDVILGVGFTGGASPYLESGHIQGLVLHSEYDAGYLSVREAVSLIEEGQGAPVELGLYVADAAAMYEPPLVHILFPIG